MQHQLLTIAVVDQTLLHRPTVSCQYIVFGCRSAADARLLSNILAATAHELAVDAIVSIIFSPGTSKPFGALAASLKVPSCLIYGREDPWVRPCYALFLLAN